jgi:hypothetical protein
MLSLVAFKVTLSEANEQKIAQLVESPKSSFVSVLARSIKSQLATLPPNFLNQKLGGKVEQKHYLVPLPPAIAERLNSLGVCYGDSIDWLLEYTLPPNFLEPKLGGKVSGGEGLEPKLGGKVSGGEGLEPKLGGKVSGGEGLKQKLGGKVGDEEEIELPIGHLKSCKKWDRTYYYWRYYTRSGKRADLYMGSDRDRAIAKALQVGVPEDANPFYVHRRPSNCKSRRT